MQVNSLRMSFLRDPKEHDNQDYWEQVHDVTCVLRILCSNTSTSGVNSLMTNDYSADVLKRYLKIKIEEVVLTCVNHINRFLYVQYVLS